MLQLNCFTSKVPAKGHPNKLGNRGRFFVLKHDLEVVGEVCAGRPYGTGVVSEHEGPKPSKHPTRFCERGLPMKASDL